MSCVCVCVCVLSCTAVHARMSAERQYYSNCPPVCLKTCLGLALVRVLYLKDCICCVLKPVIDENIKCHIIFTH